MFDEIAHGAVERSARITEVVAAAKAQEPRAWPDQAATEKRRQLFQIQVNERQWMAELSPRLTTKMSDAALI
jgi:hypothetical protein